MVFFPCICSNGSLVRGTWESFARSVALHFVIPNVNKRPNPTAHFLSLSLDPTLGHMHLVREERLAAYVLSVPFCSICLLQLSHVPSFLLHHRQHDYVAAETKLTLVSFLHCVKLAHFTTLLESRGTKSRMCFCCCVQNNLSSSSDTGMELGCVLMGVGESDCRAEGVSH